MRRVVLMCLQSTLLGSSPARYQLLEELADRGFETFVFLNGHMGQGNHFKSIHHLVNVAGMRSREIMDKIRNIVPSVVIASTYEDMRGVWLLPWIMQDTSFYYYNLEIYTPYISEYMKSDNRGLYLLMKLAYPYNKAKEIIYTKRIKALTIQDNLRRKVSEKYHIKHKTVMLIPNSYVFESEKVTDNRGEGIIFSGGITKWALSDQLCALKKVKNAPITFAGKIESEYKRQIWELRRTNPNIKFIEQQLPPEKYKEYIRQYAVGLIWYAPAKKDENTRYMGLASGKMFRYLSLGKPVIAVKCCGLSCEVRKYGLGIVIEDISQLDNAYTEIMDNYDFYNNNVIETYKIKYDYRQRVKPFLEYMEKN